MKYEIETREAWSMLNAIVGVILHYRRGCVVEIGSTFGDAVREKRQSTIILSDHAQLFDRNFYTCDIRKQVKMDYDKHRHFAISSLHFMAQYDVSINEVPAVVFLDGCHDAEVVLPEVQFFFPRLITGGVIFMHDTLPVNEKHVLDKGLCSDSYLVRQEIETWCPEKADCFTWPYTAGPHGLTMVIKKEEDRAYYRK